MSSDTGSWLITLLVIVLLWIFNALQSAAMRALDSADRNKLRELAEDEPDDRRINLALQLMKKPSVYHYTSLVTSYLNLLISTIALSYLMSLTLSWRYTILWTIVYVLLFIALADVLPKKLAAQASEDYAVGLARFQRTMCIIALPVRKVAVWIANVILFIMRKETDVDDTYFSEDKVMSMLDKGQENGDIKEEGRKMIDSIFEFDDLLAYEIMTPRTDVFMIDLRDDKIEYFDQLMELRYSRIPVCDGEPDNIVGILHIKDYLLQASREGFDNVDIEEIMREPYMVPETKNIDSLFIELQKTKQHIAILIDEYGGFSGLVSIEDIIEQIVGDIDDEFDEDDRIIEKITDEVFIVDGNVYLDDLDEETGIELESETSETIGGFLIDLMGEIPKEDAHYPPIQYDRYSFLILKVKDRRIEKIKIVIEEKDKKEKQERKREEEDSTER